MELKLPYLNPVSFANALVVDYGLNSKDAWNGKYMEVPKKLGNGSLFLFIWNDIHFFRGNWQFNEETVFHSFDPVGKKGIIDFRIGSDGSIGSAFIEGRSEFEFNTTEINGIRVFIPQKYLTDNKRSLSQKVDRYALQPNISMLLSKIFNNLDYTPENSMLLESKMLEFIFYWKEYLNNEDLNRSFCGFTNHQLSCIQSVKAIIESDFSTAPSIKELCKKTGINDFDLKRGFRQIVGYPIHQYLIKIRMDVAKELLTGTDLPITEICERLGYTNRTHFAQLYHRYYGKYPHEEKKLLMGNQSK